MSVTVVRRCTLATADEVLEDACDGEGSFLYIRQHSSLPNSIGGVWAGGHDGGVSGTHVIGVGRKVMDAHCTSIFYVCDPCAKVMRSPVASRHNLTASQTLPYLISTTIHPHAPSPQLTSVDLGLPGQHLRGRFQSHQCTCCRACQPPPADNLQRELPIAELPLA